MTRQRIHQLTLIARGTCGYCGKRPLHPESACYCNHCLTKHRAHQRRKLGMRPGRKSGLGRPAIIAVKSLELLQEAAA